MFSKREWMAAVVCLMCLASVLCISCAAAEQQPIEASDTAAVDGKKNWKFPHGKGRDGKWRSSEDLPEDVKEERRSAREARRKRHEGLREERRLRHAGRHKEVLERREKMREERRKRQDQRKEEQKQNDGRRSE